MTQLALFGEEPPKPAPRYVEHLGDAPKRPDTALLRVARRLARNVLEWPYVTRADHLTAWKVIYELAGLSPNEGRKIDWRGFAVEHREPAAHVETSVETMRRAGWIEETPEGWRLRRPEEWRRIDEPADPEKHIHSAPC
jgi:hypothetical protein